MKKIFHFAILILAIVGVSSCGSNKQVLPTSEDEYAVLSFQYGDNVSAEEAKDITDIFRVSFSPTRYNETDFSRVYNETKNRGFSNKVMTKQMMCDIGRSLGAKLVVYGTINKLMDEYSVDVQIVDVLKETTVAFEGNVFQKQDYSKEVSTLARKLALKVE